MQKIYPPCMDGIVLCMYCKEMVMGGVGLWRAVALGLIAEEEGAYPTPKNTRCGDKT
jgi:hypothetical protein